MEESQINRALEEETYWKHFHSVLFYQTLPTDFHHHLMLPKKFTENMRGKLPDKVTLKGPNEVSWDVDLVKGKDDAVLEGNEWKEFVKAYSLNKGDILMFKYNRNECFEVLVFDRSNSCEKESSYFVRKCQKARHDGDSTRKAADISAEELTDRCQEGDVDSDCTPGNTCKRNMHRTPKNYSADRANHIRGGFHGDQLDKSQSSDDEYNSISEQQNSFEMTEGTTKNVLRVGIGAVPSNSSRKRRYNSSKVTIPYAKRPSDICYRSNRRPVTELEKAKTLRMAEEKASKFPNCFLVVMRPSGVYKRFFMSIPNDWKPKLVFRKGEEVILQVEERTWACKFCSCRNHGGFQGGWKRFACENFLEEFDVCLFVPAGQKNGMYVLDVTIFRVVQEVIPPTPLTSSS
uniref:TF-B3 domain-containing protein n=1 Tax=Opuntia streptacantha TaxID=393608 RepID=A0A7C9D1Z6_OPUST